jgi:hypothetical protein
MSSKHLKLPLEDSANGPSVEITTPILGGLPMAAAVAAETVAA